MLCKIFGIICVTVGGLMAIGMLVGIIGAAMGILWFLIKLFVPVLIIYAGYRLIAGAREVSVI